MKNLSLSILIAWTACLAVFTVVFAQGNELNLSITRDWGFANFNSEIQGVFTLKGSGPANLTRIEFYIDAKKIGEASRPPFNLQFTTDNYPAGAHILRAVGTTSNGSKLDSNKLNATFISAGESGKMMTSLLIPLLAIVFGAIILSALVPLVSARKVKNLPDGALRSYPFGGRICQKCGRPFALELFNINWVTGKLAPCPYCGKWSASGTASLEKLRAAEQAELVREKGQISQVSEEEKLKKELDDSKYQDLG
jgi:hypothetical protein